MTEAARCVLEKRCLRINALTLVLAFLFAGEAAAQTPESTREMARMHFSQGVELANHGEFRRAIDEFTAAYELSPHFAVLYNIGQAYIALGKPLEGIAALERHLDEGDEQIPVERIAQVQAQIASQQALIGELRIAVNVPGASISIDDVPVGNAPLTRPLRVMTGTHTISVKAEGRPELLHSITVFAGQTLDLALDVPAISRPERAPEARTGTAPPKPLAAAARIAMDRSQPSAPPLDSQSAGTEKTLGYVLGAVGLALGGVSLAHYFWNKQRFDRWRREDDALQGNTQSNDYQERQLDNNELGASVDRAERVTVGLALGAGACVATGATLFIVDFDSGSDRGATSRATLSVHGVW